MTTEEEVYEALKYRVEVDHNGTRKYYNAAGQLHREDGPAVVWRDGSLEWYHNGLQHREDGPAAVWSDGTRLWYLNGRPHRINGPTVELPGGIKER